MTRLIASDFQELLEFASAYDLSKVSKEDAYGLPLKKGHAVYLSLLALWAEVDRKATIQEFDFLDKRFSKTDSSFLFLQETVSDVGSSLFCAMHGAYKPAHMALRSAIENYIRAIVAIFEPKALTLTSVFELFDLAKASPAFLTVAGKTSIQRLQNSYAELCKHSHSATLAHMAGIKSLQHFPALDATSFAKWAVEVKAVGEAIIRTFLDCSPHIFIGAHFSIQDMLEPNIPKDQKLRLRGAEK